MPATVQIVETNGAAPGTDTIGVNNLNFGSVDEANIDPAVNPITAQADGHSFEKWIRMYVSALGGSTQVDNLKVWVSDLGGGYATGEGISTNLRETGYSQASYADPVQSDSSVATEAMPTTEPTGANLGIGGSLLGVITSAPASSDYAVLQMDVTELTPAGPVNQKTITFQWDEI
jgi:hypothetical protein